MPAKALQRAADRFVLRVVHPWLCWRCWADRVKGCRLVDLPCGCQDIVDRHGRVVDREHDHVVCDGLPEPDEPEVMR